MNKLHAFFLGLFIAGSGTMAHAQIIKGSNGTASQPTPLKISKKSLRGIAPKGVTLRADYVKARQQYFVIAFDDVLSADAESLLNLHATYISYIPDHIYIYAAPDAQKAVTAIQKAFAGRKDVHILASGNIPLRYKLINSILEAIDKGEALPAAVVEKGIVVNTIRPEDRTALEATLDKWKIPYELTPYDEVRLTSPTSESVSRVAAIPYVLYLHPHETPEQLAFHMNWITEANRIKIVNYDHKGPIGKGVTFANWEPYGGESHWKMGSYGRNEKSLTDNTENAHGTNCGLIVSGADNLVEDETQGMAPGMRVIAMNDKLSPWGIHHNGIRTALSKGYSPLVSNHSVGWNIDKNSPDKYLDAAALIDDIIYRQNNYMCCYPTGNWAYGEAIYPPFTEPDYGRITGHIKTNKNGLAIHSTIHPGVDVTWANFGPTFDGRMKPDVCAQGSGGTSYASPGVAGLIGVLTEQFKTTYPDQGDRMDVCKAVMLNTALDVRTYAKGKEEGRGIDYRTGFGEINPPAAIKTITDRRISFDRSVIHNKQEEMTITVPENQIELRVMLYWNDPAATNGSQVPLINDLDLEVVTPSGDIILPWTLDPTPANVSKPAKRAVNRHDNAEQVIITAAQKGETLAPGKYIIRVKGHKVPRGPQKFVTTWQTRERGIIWTSIPEGYRISPGQEVLLSWDMTVSTAEDLVAPNFRRGTMTPKVYYRVSPEDKWTIASPSRGTCYWSNVGTKEVSGEVYGKNFLKWIVPSSMAPTSTLQFRVMADDMESISANAQVGERLEGRPTLLSLSEKKVKLSWKPAKKVTTGKYYIYALYDKYMQVVDSVDLPATEKEITAPQGVKWSQDQFFAVAVFDTSSKALGRRSPVIGFDPLNHETVDPADAWHPSYTLCVGDTLNLSTNQLEGKVQWYHNDAPVEGEYAAARVLKITRDNPGTYRYTIADADNKVVYTSPNARIMRSAAELADTARWGDFVWEGYVFHKAGGSAGKLPLLTDNLPFYGKFTLPSFSFDSHHTLFPWNNGRASDIEGFAGCTTSSDSQETVIVMKRKGFLPGKYSLKFERASGVAEIFVRDGEGRLLKKKVTPVNSHQTTIGIVALDENSTIEIHWTGTHLSFTANLQIPSAEIGNSPAHVSPRPGFWFDANNIEGKNGSEVKRIIDAYPQAETLSLIGSKGALLNTSGSNYNATLNFKGACGYIGGMRKANTTTNATDFIVVNAERGSGGERLVSFGKGKEDITDEQGYSIFVDANGYYTTQHKGGLVFQHKGSAGVPRLLTIRRTNQNSSISVNGDHLDGQGKPHPQALSLRKMTIGTSFDPADPKFFRGQLAEVVHYDFSIPAASENRIRTYLAIKHGITLNHDYISGSNILFPVGKNAYKHQITGLGRDDKSRLHQKQSCGTHYNGYPAMLTIALGDLAESNAASPSALTDNLAFYVAGANSNDAPNVRTTGDVSRVAYLLKRTLPADAVPQQLSFYLPANSFKLAGKTPYIEFSATEITAPAPAATSKLVELKPYTGKPNLLRADYTPTDNDTYFRVVWKTTVPNAIADVLIDAGGSAVSHDPEASAFVVNVKNAVSLDLTDLQGRNLGRNIAVKGGRAKTTPLPMGVYVVKVLCKDGTSHAVKVTVSQ